MAVLEGAAQTVEAVYADDFTYFAAEGEGDLLTVEQAVSPQVSAPVTKGQILGKATVSFNGEVLGEVNLAAGQDVAQVIVKTFPKSLKKLFGVLLHLM